MPGADSADCPGGVGLYTKEIQGMMYGFGDCREPRKDTADIIEKILRSQLIKFLELLTEVAAKIGSKKIGVNEFLVLLRHKPVKLRKFCKYLQITNFRKLKGLDTESKDNGEFEWDQIQSDSKQLQDALNFLQHLDPSGYLVSVADPTKPSPLLDESMIERNTRIESMTTTMSVEQYCEYAKMKACSFKRNQPTRKFQDWLLQGSSEVPMTSKAWDILSYFAYETVAQIVDLAFLVRRDNEAGQSADPIERNTVPRVSPLNAELNKPSWSNCKKPLEVSEVMEAVRRYNCQLPCSSPFSHSGKRGVQLFGL